VLHRLAFRTSILWRLFEAGAMIDPAYFPYIGACENNEAALGVVIVVVGFIELALAHVEALLEIAVGRFVDPRVVIFPTLLLELIAQT
jgi:hypothetical protein